MYRWRIGAKIVHTRSHTAACGTIHYLLRLTGYSYAYKKGIAFSLSPSNAESDMSNSTADAPVFNTLLHNCIFGDGGARGVMAVKPKPCVYSISEKT